jgi:anti-sigma B factor antagonist
LVSTYDETATHWSPTTDAAAEDVLRVEVNHGAGCTVLRVDGEVDALTGPLFVGRIVEAVDAAVGMVVIDLTGVGFFGSAGIAALVEARRAAGRRALGLRIVCHDRVVLVPLRVAGVLDQFEVYSDLAAAVPA